MAQPRAAKRPRHHVRDSDDYLPGNIVEIEIHNFMTYDHITCKPASRLNLVIGPNGSGKSSLVCTIALGLAGEPQKTKPTQHSVQGLRGLGLTPNLLACRSTKVLGENVKEKLSKFCHVSAANIVTLHDVSNIWHILLPFNAQKAHEAILKELNLLGIVKELNLEKWLDMARNCDTLHVPFPLLSKSSRLQKLVAASNEENNDEIDITDIPGGPAAFEICAKFCYGMTVTLNAYNVVVVRCAAEYLEMHETIEKGNLIYKVEVFLSSSILRSWKDSIIVLQTTKSLLPMSEDLKVVSHCIDSIASKASIDPSEVEWSYTYNRKKLPSENGHDSHLNGVRKQLSVPKDW